MKRIKGHKYFSGMFLFKNNKFELKELPENRLYSKNNRPTKITEKDLPEYFIKTYSGSLYIYIDCSNVKSLKYKHIDTNHIFKDAILEIEYNDNTKCNVYGSYIIDALKTIVKYNDIDLTDIKNEMIRHFTNVNERHDNLIGKDAKEFVEEIFNEIYKN